MSLEIWYSLVKITANKDKQLHRRLRNERGAKKQRKEKFTIKQGDLNAIKVCEKVLRLCQVNCRYI